MKKTPERAYVDFRKVILVAVSCKTALHCEGALDYVVRYSKCYDINAKKNPGLYECCMDVVEYLMDTKRHIERGFHQPAWKKWQTHNVYPDINNYHHLGIKIKNY